MKKNILFAGIALLMFTTIARASGTDAVTGKDSVERQRLMDHDLITATLDSLTQLLFKVPDHEYVNKYNFKADDVPVYDDSVYEARIAQLQTLIPISYNDYVKPFVNMYAVKRRGQVERMIGLSKFYFPLFEEILDRYDLPIEFKYLAVVESALNPHAVSRRGATGLWQFMYSTARMYDLKINSYIDERRDPTKSTEAAAKYFSDLYDVYGDWLLVIASYNCGPGNVNKAIRRSGGKRTFWEIRDYLPRETRGYVPAFIASTYIMSYPDEHNFRQIDPVYRYHATDTVMVKRKTTFKQIAQYTETQEEEIAFLNPSFKKHIIPASHQPNVIYLPFEKIAFFDLYADSIFKEMPLPPAPKKVKAHYASYQPSRPNYNYDNLVKLTYTVKSGDNLGFIAEWYDCKAQDLRNWNHIYGNRIKPGQNLKVYVAKGQEGKYRRINGLSFQQKQAIEGKQSPRNMPEKLPKRDGNYHYYTVRSGDTLWDIAKKFPGTSVENIKQINNINNSRRLKPGMVIKIAISG